jgi:hypothetical protein
MDEWEVFSTIVEFHLMKLKMMKKHWEWTLQQARRRLIL